ncbi:MAG TPA: hypothetical protein PKH24_06020 [Sedimentisphaerales bacterium]|jgi:hypothetical protein|nr:hypothetical protein [Sedimentisphaerales bacterium]HNU27795.1 hypothetical protein [Sedimentisphaerales bacterium]
MIVRRAFSAIRARRAAALRARRTAVLGVGCLVLTWLSISNAQVDSRRIDEVIKKSVLTQQDFEIIDAFAADAIGRLVRTVDFTEVAKTRASIVSHQSAQAQYAQRFSEACLREILKGFDYATNEITDPQRRFKVFANLLILAHEMNDPRLVDVGIRMIGHEADAVRYWAVRAATSPAMWEKLSQDQAAAATASSKILEACDKAVQTSSAEVLNVMAQFAGRYDTPTAVNLLVHIADVRAKDYADWAVRYELVDKTILRLLGNKIGSTGSSNEQAAKAFAQLYSYAIQRYIRGMQNNMLRGMSQNYLASVLIETEEQCLGKLLGGTQTGIRRALEGGDLNALQAEHDRLLGGSNQPGVLPTRLNFSYGAAGAARTAPLALPEPKQNKASAEAQPSAQP